MMKTAHQKNFSLLCLQKGRELNVHYNKIFAEDQAKQITHDKAMASSELHFCVVLCNFTYCLCTIRPSSQFYSDLSPITQINLNIRDNNYFFSSLHGCYGF